MSRPIVEETLVKGRVIGRLTYKIPDTYKELPRYQEIPFYSKQVRITLRNCGMIDPEKIDEYIARGGYEGLSHALFDMTREEVIEEVKLSGLRGRGGAGFSTGTKWEFTAKAPGDIKYVVCNADEGDPGAFMDRSILEGDPHSLIEGMTICGYAVGAKEGYIYCRAEYPLAIKRLKNCHCAGRGIWPFRRQYSWNGFQLPPPYQRRCRGLCLRRRNCPFSLHRRPSRRTPPPTSFPRDLRTLGQTHEPEQREKLCQRPSDHRQRGQVVQQHRNQAKPRNCHLCPHRQGEQHRPCGSPHGHHPR